MTKKEDCPGKAGLFGRPNYVSRMTANFDHNNQECGCPSELGLKHLNYDDNSFC